MTSLEGLGVRLEWKPQGRRKWGRSKQSWGFPIIKELENIRKTGDQTDWEENRGSVEGYGWGPMPLEGQKGLCQVLVRVLLNFVFYNIKQVQALFLPSGAISSQGSESHPGIFLAGSNPPRDSLFYTLGWREELWELRVLSKNKTQSHWPGSNQISLHQMYITIHQPLGHCILEKKKAF